jgi:hypothetical protein
MVSDASTVYSMAIQIADVLADSGLTRAEFCRRVAVSQKHMSLVLNGNALAHPSTLDYWAWMLGRHFSVRLVKGRQP